MNNITHFFWWCSGADTTILSESPSEKSRYFGIGATVLFTGIFAAISGGYAFHMVFESYVVTTAMALLWGLMIFNLDRYIVSGMKKKKSVKSEILMATPRIILAALIAIVISKPLELKIFEREIDTQLLFMEQEKKAHLDSVIEAGYSPSIAKLEGRNRQLKTDIQEKEALRDRLVAEAQAEADGTGGSGRRNPGPIYRIKKNDAQRVEKELDSLKNFNEILIAKNISRIDSLNTALYREQQAGTFRFDGLAGKLEALNRLTRESRAIAVANIFIVLLFLAIETAPVFVKLIADKGPYDDLLEESEFKQFAKSRLGISQTRANTLRESKGFSKIERNSIEGELSQ